MTTAPRYLEQVDKENENHYPLIAKKDKSYCEETYVKKTVLGEASQPKIIEE
jgi:hypothetical protein